MLYHSDQSSLYIILGREVGATLYEVLKSLKIKLTNSSNSEILRMSESLLLLYPLRILGSSSLRDRGRIGKSYDTNKDMI